jgi:hypothetical protein
VQLSGEKARRNKQKIRPRRGFSHQHPELIFDSSEAQTSLIVPGYDTASAIKEQSEIDELHVFGVGGPQLRDKSWAIYNDVST